ncbi:MAG TPA: 3-deoxy-7-phosphoheptulonate synthase [Terriglobales bacterium]|nr:3-deoxy-7-phosphoheptulonate synthase [Terriglobales bacterium]
MLLRIHPHATAHEVNSVREQLHSAGFETHALAYMGAGAYAAVPAQNAGAIQAAGFDFGHLARIEVIDGYGLCERRWRPQGTRVRVGDVEIGGEEVVVIAGPCSVESFDQIMESAQGVRAAGGHLLRGGAYKPRTSTYEFQGLGPRGLELLAEAGARYGLPVVTEVMTAEDVPLVAEFADMLQVGARNMQNYPLLKRLGGQRKPVLLKRAPSASLREWLGAAEYVLARGNDQVVLCERGIRGFDSQTRNTFDLGALAALRELTHLPVVADPSHATGRRDLITPMARAAVAAGADGVCVEVHPEPDASISDRDQAITPQALAHMMPSLRGVAMAIGRKLSGAYSTTCREVYVLR